MAMRMASFSINELQDLKRRTCHILLRDVNFPLAHVAITIYVSDALAEGSPTLLEAPAQSLSCLPELFATRFIF